MDQLSLFATVIEELPPAKLALVLDTANALQSKGVVDVTTTDVIFSEMLKVYVKLLQKEGGEDPKREAAAYEAVKVPEVAAVFKDQLIKMRQDDAKEIQGVQIAQGKYLEELHKFKQSHLPPTYQPKPLQAKSTSSN